MSTFTRPHTLHEDLDLETVDSLVFFSRLRPIEVIALLTVWDVADV